MLSVVVLTPPGRGAVSTLAVSGHGATATVAQLFAPAVGCGLVSTALGQIILGHWGGATGEELVVCRRADNEIEIHCHGGEAAVSAVLASLIERGCRQVDWRDWIRGRTDDLIAAQAIEALAHATTLRGAAVLVDQYHGALANELERCANLAEAADEASWRTAESRLRSLAERACIGRRLCEPFRVVVAGKPNVGKSSLINALAGYERSIVYDQPGTTRDVVTVRTAIAGWPVELSDTAGLRSSGDSLEAAGVQLALERMSAADLCLLVFDAGQPWSHADGELAAQWPDAVVVYNKSDLASSVPESPHGIATSAVQGRGIEELLRVVGERLVPDPPAPGTAIPFTRLHEAVIDDAIVLLQTGKHAAAGRLLRELRRPESFQ